MLIQLELPLSNRNYLIKYFMNSSCGESRTVIWNLTLPNVRLRLGKKVEIRNSTRTRYILYLHCLVMRYASICRL
jgi:hypothetical protein